MQAILFYFSFVLRGGLANKVRTDLQRTISGQILSLRVPGFCTTMIEWADFIEQMQGALAHLYDQAYLQGHPLAQSLGHAQGADARGRTLRRLLLDAIQDLKPTGDMPQSSPDWRHYEYLYRRYVEAQPVATIAGGLAVSERQTRRRHRDALAALARVLWDRWQALARPSALDPLTQPGALLLDAELERLESSRPSATVDLTEIVNGALVTTGRLAEQHAVPLSFVHPSKPIFIEGDRTILRQIVLAMLVFAINQASQCTVQLPEPLGQKQVVLRIQARCSHAPGASSRLDNDEDPVAEIQRLLRIQRGAIDLSSTGSDLRIDVTLPAAPIQTILIIDDNPDLLQLFRRYLVGHAYRVIEARSVDEALDLIQDLRPACIVLDIMMPTRDGWELLQMLQAQAMTKDVPVIICSVLQQRDLARSLGAADFLVKPVNQQSLLATLERWVPRNQRERSSTLEGSE